MGLTGVGFLFTVLGVLFFFDRGLLAMGNVSAGPYGGITPCTDEHPRTALSSVELTQLLFLAGVMLTIGFQPAFRFFIRPKNYKVSCRDVLSTMHTALLEFEHAAYAARRARAVFSSVWGWSSGAGL